MLLQRRWENELGIWVVFDETRGGKSLDWLVVLEAVALTASSSIAISILHTTSTTAVGFRVPTRLLHTEGLGSIEDRAVTCASAEISVKGFLHSMLRGVGIIAEQSVEAHDNSGRAKAALTSISLRNSLLGGMRPLHIPNSLNCDNVLSIHTDQWCQAGIDTGMVYFFRCRVVLRDHHCASSASTFSASQLCTREANATEIFEESYFGIDIVDNNAGAVEVESEGIVVGDCNRGE